MTETPHRPVGISTEAGQPPIGKPLIVQARGQLRLTWRLYAESPQSGEISLSCGMPQAGELSTQRLNSPRGLSPPIPARPPARDDGGGRQHTVISKGQMAETPHRPVVISAEAGQPPIGKPLIVQARGQLRLTWRLYAESPQSGEISLSQGMQQAGCLSSWGDQKKGREEMMTISSQPFFKREYQMRIMLPAAKRRQ